MKVSDNGYGHLKINSSVYLYNQGFPGVQNVINLGCY